MSVDLTTVQADEMNLRVLVTVEAIIEAVEELGGKISWTRRVEPIARLRIEAAVNQEDAAESMDSHWFAPEEQPLNQCWPDACDLADFVRSCQCGDRRTALALLPRLTDAPAAQAAAEQLLLIGGRA